MGCMKNLLSTLEPLLAKLPVTASVQLASGERIGPEQSAVQLIFRSPKALAALLDGQVGSLGAAIQFLFDRGADDVTAICLLGTPEGLETIEKLVGDRNVTLVLGALDERLNEKGYIVPGLGDAGDRLYGTV